MSRSFKKPIIKDKDKSRNKILNRIVRRRLRQVLNTSDNLENLELPNPKTIVNDYTYCDWINSPLWWGITKYYTREQLEEDKIKYSRK